MGRRTRTCRSPNVVQYGPNTRQNGVAGRTRNQHEPTRCPTSLNLQNLHPRFKSGRRLHYFHGNFVGTSARAPRRDGKRSQYVTGVPRSGRARQLPHAKIMRCRRTQTTSRLGGISSRRRPPTRRVKYPDWRSGSGRPAATAVVVTNTASSKRSRSASIAASTVAKGGSRPRNRRSSCAR